MLIRGIFIHFAIVELLTAKNQNRLSTKQRDCKADFSSHHNENNLVIMTKSGCTTPTSHP